MDSLSAVRRGPFRSPAKACSGKRKSTAGSVVWRSNRGCATVKLARCYSTAAGLFEHNSVPSTRHLPSFGELLKSPITFSWFLRPAPRKLLCFPPDANPDSGRLPYFLHLREWVGYTRLARGGVSEKLQDTIRVHSPGSGKVQTRPSKSFVLPYGYRTRSRAAPSARIFSGTLRSSRMKPNQERSFRP